VDDCLANDIPKLVEVSCWIGASVGNLSVTAPADELYAWLKIAVSATAASINTRPIRAFLMYAWRAQIFWLALAGHVFDAASNQEEQLQQAWQ